MKIYDISQELLTAAVYDGDPAPSATLASDMSRGDLYNLTVLSLCAHNGTHIDAPRHFIKDGTDVAHLPLDKTVGYATVITATGDLTAEWMGKALGTAREASPEAAKRILIKGNATLTLPASQLLADEGVCLIGTESQSVGPAESPMAVHLTLLEAGVIPLEGLRLAAVPDGIYLLAAQPISIVGADGAPCRAILISL